MRTDPRSSRSAQRGVSVLSVMLCASLACATPAPGPTATPIAKPESVRAPLPTPSFGPQTLSVPDARPRPATVRLLEERRFSLNVQDAELRSVLLGLGRKSAFNTVIEPGIEGVVTADLEGVSLREILEQLLRPHGYRYAVSGNILRVFQAERSTRTYRIDYPNYSRRGTSDLTISGAIAAKPQVGTGGSADAAEDTSSAGVQTTQVVDFWNELDGALRRIVFGGTGEEEDEGNEDDEEVRPAALPDRSVVVARQSGLVTITAEPEILKDVEEYLREVALATERQVLIDVKILEVDLGDDLSLGVDWDVAVGLGDVSGTIPRGGGFDPAFLAQELAPTLLGGGFMFGIAHKEFSAAVNALATQRDVRVVSTPRLATLNNHKALIKVVRNEVFFIAEVEPTIIDEVGVAQVTQFIPQIVPVGVTLDITPQISADGVITMHLHPSISEVVDIVEQPPADPELDAVGSLPVIDLRETDTVMRVEDGVSVLIGGLLKSRQLDRQRKVPVFGDIPWIGQLFRLTEIEESRAELIILVTPTVLDAPVITRVREDARRSLERLDELREDRLHEGPWWRQPFFETYGLGFDDDAS